MADLTAAQIRKLNYGMNPIATELELGSRLQKLQTDGTISVPSEGAASSVSRLVIRKNAISDNSATAILTLTCPNAEHSAILKLTILAKTATSSSTRCAEGLIAFTRTAGANLVGVVATLDLAQIASIAAGETLTLAYGVGAVGGAVGASNTMTVTLTLDTSAAGDGEALVVAELINTEATGITMAAA